MVSRLFSGYTQINWWIYRPIREQTHPITESRCFLSLCSTDEDENRLELKPQKHLHHEPESFSHRRWLSTHPGSCWVCQRCRSSKNQRHFISHALFSDITPSLIHFLTNVSVKVSSQHTVECWLKTLVSERNQTELQPQLKLRGWSLCADSHCWLLRRATLFVKSFICDSKFWRLEGFPMAALRAQNTAAHESKRTSLLTYHLFIDREEQRVREEWAGSKPVIVVSVCGAHFDCWHGSVAGISASN